MTSIDVPEATGTVHTDTIAKGKAALKNLATNDLLFIHIKGTDSASHDGKYLEKVAMLEKIDRMVALLIENTNPDETIFALTADHANPIAVRDHTADPVPLAISGYGVLSDNIAAYSERSCAAGGLGRIRGVDLMPILMDLIDKCKKFGA
jgi:2,3-bisphosphoglycerate-independent phosphoglycerate mutase